MFRSVGLGARISRGYFGDTGSSTSKFYYDSEGLLAFYLLGFGYFGYIQPFLIFENFCLIFWGYSSWDTGPVDSPRNVESVELLWLLK